PILQDNHRPAGPLRRIGSVVNSGQLRLLDEIQFVVVRSTGFSCTQMMKSCFFVSALKWHFEWKERIDGKKLLVSVKYKYRRKLMRKTCLIIPGQNDCLRIQCRHTRRREQQKE